VTSFIRLYKKLTSSVKKTNWAQTTSSWLVSPMMSSLGIQVQTSQEYFSFLEMCFGVYPILRNVTVPKNSVGAKQLGANFDFIAIKQAFIRSFLCTYGVTVIKLGTSFFVGCMRDMRAGGTSIPHVEQISFKLILWVFQKKKKRVYHYFCTWWSIKIFLKKLSYVLALWIYFLYPSFHVIYDFIFTFFF